MHLIDLAIRGCGFKSLNHLLHLIGPSTLLSQSLYTVWRVHGVCNRGWCGYLLHYVVKADNRDLGGMDMHPPLHRHVAACSSMPTQHEIKPAWHAASPRASNKSPPDNHPSLGLVSNSNSAAPSTQCFHALAGAFCTRECTGALGLYTWGPDGCSDSCSAFCGRRSVKSRT